MSSEPQSPKVFISYSHDSQEHFDRVLLLSDTLREWGIDCHIDQYELAPADWLRWMERRIREADFVLIVCTATYCRRFNGEEEPGKGLGVRHEGGVISVELYNRQTETAKFIPVVFSVPDAAHIPNPLQATNRHALNIEQLETDRGFENLYRQLTSQPRVAPKPLGKIRPLPPINRREEFDEEEIKPASPIIPPPKPKIIEPPKPRVIHQNFAEDLGNGVKLEMIAIPGGSFQMGSEDWFDDAKPVHRVTLSPFHIGKFQVTQAQWQAVMKNNPSRFKGDTLPVEQVSWNEVSDFCRKLSEKIGKEYCLPTEAQWEYACRAGSTGRYCFGDNKNLLEQYAWYDKLLFGKTHPVGEKLANDWGLHDMHGNVWEWCADWYGSYSPESTTDPKGASSGSNRVIRGGGWGKAASLCRSASRGAGAPSRRDDNIGFRLVRIGR